MLLLQSNCSRYISRCSIPSRLIRITASNSHLQLLWLCLPRVRSVVHEEDLGRLQTLAGLLVLSSTHRHSSKDDEHQNSVSAKVLSASPEPQAKATKRQRRTCPTRQTRRVAKSSGRGFARPGLPYGDSDSGEECINVALPQYILDRIQAEEEVRAKAESKMATNKAFRPHETRVYQRASTALRRRRQRDHLATVRSYQRDRNRRAPTWR
jgi:hypothetical protein